MKDSRLSAIVRHLLSQNINRESIRLAVGELILDETQIQNEWKTLTSSTPLAGAPLNIRIVPARQQCMVCFFVYHPVNRQIACPQCRGVGAKIISGEEFFLDEE